MSKSQAPALAPSADQRCPLARQLAGHSRPGGDIIDLTLMDDVCGWLDVIHMGRGLTAPENVLSLRRGRAPLRNCLRRQAVG